MITASSPGTITASPPAEATERGFRVGRTPLPYVALERGAVDAIVLERGGFGGRPAYVRCERDVVLASTDLAWVVERSRALGLALTVDPDRLAADCLLDPGAVGRTQTTFREIAEVPPATRAHVALGRMTLTRLPAPAPAPREVAERGGTDLVDRLRALLFAAIERAVEGAPCVGVLTGGGLDSSALLSM
ncbi:MAG: hypothetical protein QOI41_1540, partial [Myxococcales bacterium]|nr:hypothetical protein [Myxococcales bacterium]